MLVVIFDCDGGCGRRTDVRSVYLLHRVCPVRPTAHMAVLLRHCLQQRLELVL